MSFTHEEREQQAAFSDCELSDIRIALQTRIRLLGQAAMMMTRMNPWDDTHKIEIDRLEAILAKMAG